MLSAPREELVEKKNSTGHGAESQMSELTVVQLPQAPKSGVNATAFRVFGVSRTSQLGFQGYRLVSMPISRQLVLPLRTAGHTWSNPRQLLCIPGVTRYTTSAIAQRLIKPWQSRLPSGACIHGNRHTYSSWTWDWTNLLRAPAKAKSKGCRRWKFPRPNKDDIVNVLIFSAVCIALENSVWKEYQVVAKESYSETISIVTVRESNSDLEGALLSADQRREQRADQRREQQERGVWKDGIWTLQVSDYIKRFPRIYGNISPYTPLPPLDGQDHAYRRLLVHTEDAVDKKLSARGSLIRMARPFWIGYSASIPKDVQQVVLFASGVTGIAPMLQTIHTLLEARRGDGIDGQRPEIHVVWFKQNPEHVNESKMAPSYATSLEASTADKIASAELERFRLLHPDKTCH
jgi:hypothetical protein